MSQKRSRVQKHADLRDSIMRDNEEKIETKELSSFASKLHQIDDNHFESMSVASSVESHSPLHLRDSFYESEDVNTEKIDSLIEQSSVELIEDTDSFRGNYLQEFIDEAKQYNVEKGFRVDHDTRSNLLRELRAQHIVSEEEIEQLENDDEHEYLETLSDDDLFQEPEIVDEPEFTDPLEDSIMMKVAEYSEEELDDNDYFETTGNTGLLEATTRLQVQIEEQDQYVKDMGSKLDKTNKAMNVLLTMLIIFIIAIIIVVGYLLLSLYEII
jgi:hypothetical protein